jgi:hypothetical protein
MWCLLVIAFIPYVLALLGIYYRIKQFGDWTMPTQGLSTPGTSL